VGFAHAHRHFDLLDKISLSIYLSIYLLDKESKSGVPPFKRMPNLASSAASGVRALEDATNLEHLAHTQLRRGRPDAAPPLSGDRGIHPY